MSLYHGLVSLIFLLLFINMKKLFAEKQKKSKLFEILSHKIIATKLRMTTLQQLKN